MENQPKEKFEYEVDKYWFKFSNFIGLVFGFLCIWFSYIKSGDNFFQMRGIEVSRVDDPILFWFNILFCFLGGVFFIYLGLGPFFHWLGKRLPNEPEFWIRNRSLKELIARSKIRSFDQE